MTSKNEMSAEKNNEAIAEDEAVYEDMSQDGAIH